MVLPDTDLDRALAVAEQIRSRCAGGAAAIDTGSLPFTASFGVAALAPDPDPSGAAAEALLRHADAALYRSKREGRNRVSGGR